MKKNPYAPKANTHDYGSLFNLFYAYFENRQESPMVREISPVLMDEPTMISAGFRKIFSHDSEGPRGLVNNLEVCYERSGALVSFCRKESVMDRIDRMGRHAEDSEDDSERVTHYSCKILYGLASELDGVLELIQKAPDERNKGRIYLLCHMDGMLELQRFETRLPDGQIDMRMNYGDDASSKFEKIAGLMDSGRNGLVLLSGHPGTGKSTFIKMLSTRTSRKVIYLSSTSAEQLTNPEFLSFMMKHRNSVLLLEDAEKVLRTRDEQDNSAISNLLNITDGILGDCLNLMVIATFNIEREKIDPALVRKGRLLVEHHFEPLSADNANLLLESLGSGRRVSSPTSLAEIYNPDDNFHHEKEKRKVGF